ncbi:MULTISPECIES: alpha/beta fold hydrolase [Oceanobacillus]|uniref:Alpha/beta hydrolase n=1 Tax=Oceanobacillus kimchii TaxID=746691 RepID=A0ABQ5TGP1_9BACI|nr:MULTISPECIES: alpha/beta fold hydrolase [Oceanobacillus]MBT2652853.1 alpha/beta fold hydrolase [Oceanobacillus sp. ISL-73]OEH53598.1 hypothetical protein AQ616_13990 [Oceanobacillus sp. E9]GLO64886.1 hypothetical protein MACH08_06700 [Oceanobacillus kimchii]
MGKKSIISLVVGIVILIGAAIFMFLYPGNTRSEIYEGEPTVFIHGYKGTEHSFGFMLDRFENKYGWGNKGFVYYVTKDGQVLDYNLNKGRYAPTFVQIVLEDNRASFADSAQWISSVLLHMQSTYNIDRVNLVGHSMGGIIALKYTMEFASQGYPEVDKLITIGSPFDGIYSEEYFQIHNDEAAEDLKPGSNALQLLQTMTFPSDVKVLNIASTGDSVAVPQSVGTLRSIIPPENFKEVIIENQELGHSGLHESVKVDKLIHSFLWQESDE